MTNAKNRKDKKQKRSVASPPSEKRRTRYVWLKVMPEELWLKVQQGITIWEALHNEDLELEGDCGGLGKCGKCKVRVLTSIEPPTEEERAFITQEEEDQGIRLACRTPIDHDMVIHIGESDPDMEYFQILKSGYRPLFQLDPLIDQHPVTLASEGREEGLADFDQIKLAMGPGYEGLTASPHCLRSLPRMLRRNPARGVAVLHGKQMLAWQNWVELGRRYGLVFDLGTSTLVGKLIDLADGTELAAISRLNGQIRWGTDVISRIQYAKSSPYGLTRLHNLLIANLNRIARRLLEVSGLKRDDVFIAVAAGNTTMQHLLLNLPPFGIAEAPFTPVVTDGMIVRASDLNLHMHPEALLYTMPMKSGYIGGDLISFILASSALEQENEVVLGLDLGTNGEIFLGNPRRMMTCSAAAGPALEGSRISHGMIARSGAIEGVTFENGDLHYRDVGNIKPVGICGSGLVDLVAILLDCGTIDHEGLIYRPPRSPEGLLCSRVIENPPGHDFLIASPEESYHGKSIYLTQRDVRELQLAKAAIAAGIQTLMDEMGIGIGDINRVYLAGALGNYVNPQSAMRIGLLPKVDPEIVTPLGNAASTGASMVLLSKYYWQMASEIADFVEHVELSSRIDFNEYFISHMDFPVEMEQPVTY